MHDNDFFAHATARMLMIETPADKIQVAPIPPASEREAAMMWHPTDRVDDAADRIPLAKDGDRDAQALAALWMSGTALHALMMDARPERRQEPGLPRKDEEESKEK